MRLAVLAIVAVVAGLAAAPVASAGCASAVVVDGRWLLGHQVLHPSRLPPRVGPHDAIAPACNDTNLSHEVDQPTTVLRLRGLPVGVAAVPEGRRDTVYMAPGSLPELGSHPLHAALFESARTPSYHGPRRCRPYSTALRGRVVEDGALRLRLAHRTVFVSADAFTRFTNRPAYQPVLKGQRLRVVTSRCGPRRVADHVTFVGRSPVPVPYTSSRRTSDGWAPGLAPRPAAGLVLLCAGGLLAGRRRA